MKLGDLPEQFNFPVGSMFWARSSVLSKFVELDLAWGDYPPEPIPIDGTMVHAIERLFGVVPATMGMSCAVTNVPGADALNVRRRKSAFGQLQPSGNSP